MRRRGTRIVWMAHNLRPHELRAYRRLVWPAIENYLLRICDGFMTLAPSTIEVVRREFPALAAKPATAALHPLYPRATERADRDACRRILSLPSDGPIFVLLGMLRPYKGAEELIAAFGANSNPRRRLLIAGSPATREYGEHIQRLAGRDARIVLKLGYLDDSDFAMYLDAADAMVLPYQGGQLHSGALVHAISHGCPVITRAGPFADDVAAAAGEAWVARYRGTLTPEVLETWSKPQRPPDLTAFQPGELGRAAAALYRRLL
jgi:beta-1,4-mannosyltransferase